MDQSKTNELEDLLTAILDELRDMNSNVQSIATDLSEFRVAVESRGDDLNSRLGEIETSLSGPDGLGDVISSAIDHASKSITGDGITGLDRIKSGLEDIQGAGFGNLDDVIESLQKLRGR